MIMKKRLFSLFLNGIMAILSGLLLTGQADAQQLAYAAQVQKQAPVLKEMKLKNALLSLQQHYGAEILFEDRIVDPLSIFTEDIDFKKSLEKNLELVLNRTGLSYKKVRKNTYVVSLRRPSAKPEPAVAPSALFGKTEDETAALQADPEVPPFLTNDRVIRGKVTESSGETLPGVNVVVKGTQTGTVTNADGVFSLSIPDEQTTLVFSFVGYRSQEVAVETQTIVNITMEVDEKALEEVVVVGYGTMRKNDLTGSIVTANLEAFKEAPNTNILQSIKGSIPGLEIGQTNQAGAEPSIQIRGRNTINGNRSVLIVLDGIVYNGRLGDINPADIASLNILKDASSKAIYGAQAANGVILITTKSQSKEEKPTITYSTYIASQTPTSNMRLRNSAEKKQIIRDIYLLEISTIKMPI